MHSLACQKHKFKKKRRERKKKEEEKRKEPHRGPKLNCLHFFCFNCLTIITCPVAFLEAKHSNRSHRSAYACGITTNTSPSPRRFGNLAYLQIYYVGRKASLPTKKDSCICNKPTAFDTPVNRIS